MEIPWKMRTLLAATVVILLAGTAFYAVVAPSAAVTTGFTEPAPTATSAEPQTVVVTELVTDESDQAIADAAQALGLAEFVSEDQLMTVLPPEVVRVLIDRGAVLEVPAGVDIGVGK